MRVYPIVIICFLILHSGGCAKPKEVPIWEKVKIGDLAPTTGKARAQAHFLNTIGFDVHIFEVPAENTDKLVEVWESLYIRPVRFYSKYAFQANMFSVGYGDTRMWSTINDAITAAGGLHIIKASLLLAPDNAQDVTITALRGKQPLNYVSTQGSHEQVSIGPGILSLRIKATTVPGARDTCSMAAAPAFSLPMAHSIPPLAKRIRAQEIEFTPAGFGVRMSPKDLVVLAPSMYISDDTMLSGLFFSNPQGGPFTEPDQAVLPKQKPAIRVFIIVCTGVK